MKISLVFGVIILFGIILCSCEVASKLFETDEATKSNGDKVAVPQFNPAPGEYTTAQEVQISCPTTGSQLFFTLDQSIPTRNSSPYIAPINVTETTTIKAIAFKDGYEPSGVETATYSITVASKDDIYEENDTIAEAYALPQDTSLSDLHGLGKLITGDTFDYYKISITEKSDVTIVCSFDALWGSGFLYLLSSTGGEVSSKDNLEQSNGTGQINALLNPGSYYIQVFSDIEGNADTQPDSYDLNWSAAAIIDDNYEENDTQITAFDLNPNNDLGTITLSAADGKGRVNNADSIDWFIFNAPELSGTGGFIPSFVSFRVISGVNISVNIYDVNNQSIFTGTASDEMHDLLNGEYFIRIEGDDEYDFELMIEDTNAQYTNLTKDTAIDLAAEEHFSASHGMGTVSLWFQFDIMEEEVVTVTYEQTEEVNLVLEGNLVLEDEDGNAIDSEEMVWWKNPKYTLENVLNPGTYYIKLTILNNGDMLEPFNLFWSSTTVPALTLEAESSVSELSFYCSDSNSYMDYQSFTLLNTGDDLSFTIQPQIDSSVYLNIYPSSGSILSGESENISVDCESFTESSGSMTITITNASGSQDISLPINVFITDSSP